MIPRIADRSPDDRSGADYLLRLLIAAVHKAGGELALPVESLVEAQAGTGLVRVWDERTKTLFLRYVPEQTEVFFVKELQWKQRPPVEQRPEEVALPSQPRTILDDQTLANLEHVRRRDQVLREMGARTGRE